MDFLRKIIHNQYLKKISEIIIFLVTIYFVIKKTTGFSLSSFFSIIFTTEGSKYIVLFLIIVIILASFEKVLSILISEKNDILIDQFDYSSCILNNNLEITEHFKKLDESKISLKTFLNFHNYKRNMGLILKVLEKVITDNIPEIDIKKGDLCLSLYDVGIFDNIDIEEYKPQKLKFIHSTNKPNHDINTLEIDLYNKETSMFACSIGFKKNKTILLRDIRNNNYVISDVERRKTIKHYIGIPLKFNNIVLGFLNIEFHNKKIFNNNSSISDFRKNILYPFQLLLEHQIAKRFYLIKLYKGLKNECKSKGKKY